MNVIVVFFFTVQSNAFLATGVLIYYYQQVKIDKIDKIDSFLLHLKMTYSSDLLFGSPMVRMRSSVPSKTTKNYSNDCLLICHHYR